MNAKEAQFQEKALGLAAELTNCLEDLIGLLRYKASQQGLTPSETRDLFDAESRLNKLQAVKKERFPSH
jgi:hypothetical protein